MKWIAVSCSVALVLLVSGVLLSKNFILRNQDALQETKVNTFAYLRDLESVGWSGSTWIVSITVTGGWGASVSGYPTFTKVLW
jgi:hypothetical protein